MLGCYFSCHTAKNLAKIWPAADVSSGPLSPKSVAGHSAPWHWHAVLQIRDILIPIRIDPDSDPVPDPAIFVSDLQDGNYKLFFLKERSHKQ
jgi:hypothetical protein